MRPSAPGTALLVASGVVLWVRRGERAALAVWIAPAVAFGLLFGSRTNFFERSYGSFLPGVFLAAGAGAAAISAFRRSGRWFAAALTALAILPAATVTYILVHASLSGRSEAVHQAYAHRLRLAAAPVPVINTWLCAPAQLDICLRLAKEIQGPFILAVGDFGDEWTARSLRQLKAALPVTQIAVIRGPFGGPAHVLPPPVLQRPDLPVPFLDRLPSSSAAARPLKGAMRCRGRRASKQESKIDP